MIIFRPKKYPEIPPHKWFAWYPVLAWDIYNPNAEYGKMEGDLVVVWLQPVYRIGGYFKDTKYVYVLNIK